MAPMMPKTPLSQNLTIRTHQPKRKTSSVSTVQAPLTPPGSSPVEFISHASRESSFSTLDCLPTPSKATVPQRPDQIWSPSPVEIARGQDDSLQLDTKPSSISLIDSPLFDPEANCPGLPASLDRRDFEYLQIVDLRCFNRTPFNLLQARALDSARRHALRNHQQNHSASAASRVSPTMFIEPTLQAPRSNQHLAPLTRVPNVILLMILRLLQQRQTDDTDPRYFYHQSRERDRDTYLEPRPKYFGRVPRASTGSTSYQDHSLWPLMHTCHDLRNRVVELVMSRKSVIVNTLDLDAFVTDMVYISTQKLQPVRFAHLYAFVPGGLHPPLPLHPFLTLAQAKIPVELVFDQETLNNLTTPGDIETNLAMRARMELTFRRLFGWMIRCSSPKVEGGKAEGIDFAMRDANDGSIDHDGDLQPHELLDTLYLRANCELYVTPSFKYKAQYPVPREFSQWWSSWQPDWIPTVSQLQADLGFLHELTGCSVWLDVSKPGKGWLPDQYDEQFTYHPYEERQDYRSIWGALDQEKASCIERIMIGDPYGLRIHATHEFLQPSACNHHLRCLFIPAPLVLDTLLLELFPGTDGDKGADNDSFIGCIGEPCDVHCRLRIKRVLETQPAREEAQEASGIKWKKLIEFMSIAILDFEEDRDLDELVDHTSFLRGNISDMPLSEADYEDEDDEDDEVHCDEVDSDSW